MAASHGRTKDDARLVKQDGISSVENAEAAASMGRRHHRRTAATGRLMVFACASLVAIAALRNAPRRSERRPSRTAVAVEDDDLEFSDELPVEAGTIASLSGCSDAQDSVSAPAFLALDEKDGRFCGKEGDMCKCHGHVRYGRLFSWSDGIVVDGSINCSAAVFNDPVPMGVKICKCYPTICTTDMGICTPEPCSCPTSQDPTVEWAKKSLMTGDGTKCWACEKQEASAGSLVEGDSEYCPIQIGRCTSKRACKCENPSDTKRVMRTKDNQKCWTCAPVGEGKRMSMGGQSAMFWMLPMLWPYTDFPDSAYQVMNGCPALTSFCALCLLGFFCQTFMPFLRLDGYFSFHAPCMRKFELWRLFTYFMLHSDLQHLVMNIFHLLDALDLEGVPNIEVSPGVPLRCTRDGPMGQICYPDVGIGRYHLVAIFAVVLAYGALIGTIKNFGALVQGASSVCFGIDGALIALYGMFLGAGLSKHLRIPEFGAFFWMRIGIIFFHIIIDILQSVCGGGRDSVGTVAHMASLVAGFCYVILVLPPMGDGKLFGSDTPYIVDCGLTSPYYTTLDGATGECLAFFRRSNGIQLDTAQLWAKIVLGGGVLISLANLWRNREVLDADIACCSWGDEEVKIRQAEEAAHAAPKIDEAAAAKAEEQEIEDQLTAMVEQCGLALKHFERLHKNIPELPDADTPAASSQPAASGA
eukprot:TRINITY_DN7317_c0_g2_i1.p1 TRINITY_DN7317_c0_g2~~TRINITY_DN7317_c0_g2_i1.p1  ORF type:complete len:698 (-),score=138.16 TRINITY_DN7317_c0_g2_i1:221-2314(-)